MKIVLITPGTGTFYCGVCLRDEALAKALRQQGHEVDTLPVYLPLVHELPAEPEAESEVFFGGINAYLQQVVPLFRRTPRFVDRWFDRRSALNLAARMGEMTRPAKLGAMTLSMLQGEEGRQRKELNRMTAWLRERPPPDLVCLATALQAGMARELKRAFPRTRVACFFQGEDEFLDALEGGYSERCWREMARACEAADVLVTPSRYFRERMAGRLRLPAEAITVLPNGIELGGFSDPPRPSAPAAEPEIGFLARMCPEKGLDLMVDAYLELSRIRPDLRARLLLMGAMRPGDKAFVAEQQAKWRAAGLEERVKLRANIDREEKVSRLSQLTLFTVPARYSEAFGLYAAEAMAAGVPCVLPDHSAFAEIVEDGTSGWIYRPHTAEALAHAWAAALDDPEACVRRGRRALETARRKFDIADYAARLVDLARSADVSGPASG